MSLDSLLTTACGRLTRDAEIKPGSGPDGSYAVVNLAVGQWNASKKEEVTTYLTVFVHGKLGQQAGQCKKGQVVIAFGNLQVGASQYTDKAGASHIKPDIVLSAREFRTGPPPQPKTSQPGQQDLVNVPGGAGQVEDHLPF